MASLNGRRSVLYTAAALVGAVLVAIGIRAWGPGRDRGAGGVAPARPGRQAATENRRTARPLFDRRRSETAVENGALSAPDPSWDSATAALWRTVTDATLDDIVREAAALKLAGRGDRQILARLWELWQQGRLPAGCSWIRDLMAATEGEGAVVQARPGVSPAEVSKAVARATNADLPLSARLEAVRRLAAAQTDEAMAILEGLYAGDFEAPAELRTAAFEALLQVDDQIAIAALAQRLSQESAFGTDELLATLEALADEPHSGARAIALSLLQNADADVREEAAWLLALNSDEVTAEDVRTLLDLLGKEDEAAVRRRLYSALGEAATPYASTILAAIRTEEATAVRLSGYQAIAAMAAAESTGTVGRLFDSQAVGELTQTALSAREYQYRFEAVVALKTAHTAGARAALARLAAEATDSRIAQAAAVP